MSEGSAAGIGAAHDTMSRVRARVLLAGVLALAAVVRVWLFVGIARIYSFRYVEVAHHVLSGGSLFDKGVFYASSRLTMMGPLIASNAVFGYGDVASTAFPLLCSLGAVFVVYALGRELVDERVGLLAALGMVVVPLEVELGTQLLPDSIEALFVPLAVLCAVLAIRRDRGWAWWAVASGASLALAYFTRVNAVVFFPGILAAGFLLDRSRWKRTLPAIAGFGAVLVAAAFAFWRMSGNPFADWARTTDFYSAYQAGGFSMRPAPYVWLMVRELPVFWAGPMMVAGVVWAFVRRRRAETFLAIWAVGFLIYLDVVSPLHGLASSYRYLEPLVAPVLLLFASAVFGIADKLRAARRERWARVAVVGACLALAVLIVPARALAVAWRDKPRWTSVRSVAGVLARDFPRETVFVDDGLVLVSLDFYSGYAFGRDTLVSPADPANRRARLFLTTERAVTPSDRGVLVSVKGLPAGVRGTSVVTYATPDGPLSVWRLSPR